MSPRDDDPGPDQPQRDDQAPWIGFGAFAALGSTIALIETAGVLGGLWVDRTFGTSPWGLLVGVVLATVAAVVSVVKQVRRFL